MPKAILEIDVKDERFRDLEKRFDRLAKDMKHSPADFRNLGKEFTASAKTLNAISKDISSWVVNLRQSVQLMNQLATSSASVNRSLAGAGGGGGNLAGAVAGARGAGGGRGGGGGGGGAGVARAAFRGSVAGTLLNAAVSSVSGLPIVGGAVSGAMLGGALGSLVMPVVGTIVGAIVGGLAGATKEAVEDVTKTALGMGDPYGISGFAGRMSNERRFMYGLGGQGGATNVYGGTRAFGNVYSRVANPEQMLAARTEAVTDPTSASALTYMMLGVEPSIADPGQAAKNMLEKVREMAKGTDESMLGPTLYQPYGLHAAGLSMSDVLRARNLPGPEWRQFQEEFSRRQSELETDDKLMHNMQTYTAQINAAGIALDTGITKAIGEKLVPSITQLSDQLARLVTQPGYVKQLADGFSDLIDLLGKYGPLLPPPRTLGPGPSGTPTLNQSQLEAQVRAYAGGRGPGGDIKALIDMGYSENEAAGIVANLMAESGGSTEVWDQKTHTHYGKAQWDADRRRDYKGIFGHEMFDVHGEQAEREQMQFLNMELHTKKFAKVLADIQGKTADKVAEIIAERYEIHGQGSGETANRAAATQVIIKIENLTGASVSTSSNQAR